MRRRQLNEEGGGEASAVYFLGFIGALVYYIQLAGNFIEGVLALPKAIIWPATVIYKLLESFYGLA